MKTNIKNNLHELEALIAKWAEDKSLLKPDETIEIDARIRKVARVTVRLEGVHSASDLNAFNLSSLGFSVRAENVLSQAGFVTVEDVRKVSWTQMRSLKNCGKKVLREIYNKFQELGVQLNWDIDGVARPQQ